MELQINFFEKFPNDYERFKEKEKIVLNIINNNDNFVMTISLIWIEKIVKKIINTNTISVNLIDNVESIYDRILFYDENDKVMPDSKEYRDKHKKYYMKQIKNDLSSSYLEYKDIPKFDIAGRKLEEIIDELSEFIFKISKECNK